MARRLSVFWFFLDAHENTPFTRGTHLPADFLWTIHLKRWKAVLGFKVLTCSPLRPSLLAGRLSRRHFSRIPVYLSVRTRLETDFRACQVPFVQPKKPTWALTWARKPSPRGRRRFQTRARRQVRRCVLTQRHQEPHAPFSLLATTRSP